MNNRICKKCKSRKIVDDGYYAGSTFYRCENCKEVGVQDNFPKQTIFDQITQSPETLAEKLVYCSFTEYYRPFSSTKCGMGVALREEWRSTITGDTYRTKSEATAATVAKLKEVMK